MPVPEPKTQRVSLDDALVAGEAKARESFKPIRERMRLQHDRVCAAAEADAEAARRQTTAERTASLRAKLEQLDDGQLELARERASQGDKWATGGLIDEIASERDALNSEAGAEFDWKIAALNDEEENAELDAELAEFVGQAELEDGADVYTDDEDV